MPKQPEPTPKATATPELRVPKELLDHLVSSPMTQGGSAAESAISVTQVA